MSDIRKTFNFRTGVQVDDETFIVRGSQVGIGTTIPTEALDVRGNAKVVGVLTATNVDISAGISTFGDVKVGTGISISASSGVITATKFVGNGSLLTNLPTSPWTQYNQTYNGATVVSIAKDLGHVGVGTTNASSNFQVGANPYDLISIGVGIKSTGNARFSGIVTASQFVGDLTGGISNLIAGGISTFTDDVNFYGQSGITSFRWDKSQNRLEFLDWTKVAFGLNNDLEIYHDMSLSSQNDSNGNTVVDGDWTSVIRESGTGGLVFKSDGGNGPGAFQFFDAGWRPLLKLHSGTQARAVLHYAGAEVLTTAREGISVTGITSSTNLKISGVSTISQLAIGDPVASATMPITVGSNNNVFLGTKYNTGTGGATVFLQHSGSNTIGVNTSINVNDEIGSIEYRAWAGNTVISRAARINAVADAAKTATAVKSALTFETNSGGITGTAEERVRISNVGYVGINSTSPRTHLEVAGITSTSELNVVGLSTFVEQVSATSVNVSGIVTASSFVGALTGNVTGNVTGNLTGNITGNTSGTAGGLTGTPDITVDDLIATKVGVNTATAAKQLHVYDDSNDVIRVNSNKDGAYVSFVDETGNWQPYVGGRGNDISFGNLTNGEKVRITGIGSVGIGITLPVRPLHVVGTSTVSDTAYFGGVVNIRGNINAPDSTLNVNELSVGSINAFNVGNQARMHSTVGITTLNKLYTTGIATFMGNVSVGTTSHNQPFVVHDQTNKRFSVTSAGFVGICTNSTGLPSDIQLTVNKNAIVKRGIGIGDTTKLEALVDFSYVGAGFTADNAIAYMLPPKNDQSGINAFSRVGGGTTIPGALVYNVTTNKMQCWDSTQWRDLW